MSDASVLPELPPRVLIDAANEKLVSRIRDCFSHPLAESFRDAVDRLSAIAKGVGGKVRLGLDFAPLSFGFALIRPDGSAWIIGGLLYHGPHDRGGDGGGPTYAVCLTPVEGWSIHT